MNFDMKEPCDNCPFRNDGKGIKLLSGARAKEIVRSIVDGQESFPCHKTVNYENDSEGEVPADAQHCAGAVILLEKMEKPNQMMRWMERIGFYDFNKMNMKAPVFDTPEAFIKHHTRKR